MIQGRKRLVEDTPSVAASEAEGFKNEQAVVSWMQLDLASVWDGVDGHFLVKVVGADKVQGIGLVYTRTGFGERPWFICPTCSKRRARLYLFNKFFACRECHDLTYLSCQAAGNDLRWWTWKVRDLQHRLGMDTLEKDVSSPDYAGIEDTPIFKPKYMKRETWDRLRCELEIAQTERLIVWTKKSKAVYERYYQ